MRTFSATEAAFAGFKLIGKNPALVLIWSLVSLLFLAAVALIIALFAGGPIMALMRSAQGGTDMAPEAALGLFFGLLPALLLMLPLAFLYNGVMVGGVSRAIMRPKENAFFFLRLGADEMRLTVVLLVQWLAGVGVNIVSSMVQSIFTIGAVGAAGLSGGGDPDFSGPTAVALILSYAVQLLSLGVMIFLNVKFCLALPQTFGTRSINIFGTWTLTNGRFWPIVGAYLLAGVLSMMLVLVVIGIFVGLALAMGISFSAMQGDPNVPVIVTLVAVGLVVYGLVLMVANTAINAVAPSIYHQIAGNEDQSTVFA